MRRKHREAPRGLAGLGHDLQRVAALVRVFNGGTRDEKPADIELVEVSPGVFAPRAPNPHDVRAARAAERARREVARAEADVRSVLDGIDSLTRAFGGRHG